MATTRRLLAALLVSSAGLLALPSVAGAGLAHLEVELVSPVEPLTFSVDIEEVTPCNPGTIAVTTVTANGAPVEPISVTEDPTDPTLATMVLPSDTPPGDLVVVATCTNPSGPITLTGFVQWSAVTVTKVIEGTPPPGATFTVHADCVDTIIVTDAGFADSGAAELPDNFTADLSYGEEGGLAYLYSDHAADCTLTEPQNGGATTVTFDPEVVEITAPEPFEATVTNTFVAPIVVEPTFTG